MCIFVKMLTTIDSNIQTQVHEMITKLFRMVFFNNVYISPRQRVPCVKSSTPDDHPHQSTRFIDVRAFASNFPTLSATTSLCPINREPHFPQAAATTTGHRRGPSSVLFTPFPAPATICVYPIPSFSLLTALLLSLTPLPTLTHPSPHPSRPS